MEKNKQKPYSTRLAFKPIFGWFQVPKNQILGTRIPPLFGTTQRQPNQVPKIACVALLVNPAVRWHLFFRQMLLARLFRFIIIIISAKAAVIPMLTTALHTVLWVKIGLKSAILFWNAKLLLWSKKQHCCTQLAWQRWCVGVGYRIWLQLTFVYRWGV